MKGYYNGKSKIMRCATKKIICAVRKATEILIVLLIVVTKMMPFKKNERVQQIYVKFSKVNLIKFDLSVFELLQAYAEQDRSME
jgi:hypothetical protein